MREILFHGKRLDNGEWVEGYYAGYGLICPNEPEDTYNATGDYCGMTPYVGFVEVDPETVGQYTGLKDKNGKKIFEWDMLKPFDDDIDKMVVEFHHGAFMLCLYGERGYMGESEGWIFEGNYGVIECEPLSSYGNDIEVIGTIHDNPELLKDGE